MTRKISIDGIIFHVEPVGFEMLKAYQDAWAQFNTDRQSLWEEQAAAYLLQRLKGRNTVTTLEDVKGLTEIFKDNTKENGNLSTPARQATSNRPQTGGSRNYFSQFALGLW